MKNISFSKTLAVTGLATTLFIGGVSATMAQFNGRHFDRPALTDEQKTKLKEVAGDREAVRALLKEFGIQKSPRMGQKMRGEHRGQMLRHRIQLTDEQKELLKEAHQSGDREKVKELLKEYGIQGHPRIEKEGGREGNRGSMMHNLTDEQRAKLQAAHEAGDMETAHKLMEEYGIKPPMRGAPENHKEIAEAIENRDYDAFIEALPEDHPEVSEADFEKIQKMHEAMQSGDRETADAIREELGFKMPHEGHRGMRGEEKEDHGKKGDRPQLTDEQKEARKAAVEAGDYDAFIEALPEDHPEVSEADFEKIQKMHEAMQSGDRETADAIREELGFKMPHEGHRGMRGEEKEDHGKKGDRPQLTDEQKEALKAAHQSGDREKVKELLKEYGIERGPHGGDHENR